MPGVRPSRLSPIVQNAVAKDIDGKLFLVAWIVATTSRGSLSGCECRREEHRVQTVATREREAGRAGSRLGCEALIELGGAGPRDPRWRDGRPTEASAKRRRRCLASIS